jgi:hypothetical protein
VHDHERRQGRVAETAHEQVDTVDSLGTVHAATLERGCDTMTEAAPEVRVSTLELFFDLVFVFVLTQMADALALPASALGGRPDRADHRELRASHRDA